MTDEREDAFSKLDSLQNRLSDVDRANAELTVKLAEASSKPPPVQSASVDSSHDDRTAASQHQHAAELKHKDYQAKIDLLENEIRYFKQQIEILLHTQQEMNVFLGDKEQSIANLNKLLEKYESDREKFNALLEQTHNDKQTLSRCLKQNNELKEQLTELQDAYVKLTNSNVELTGELESERFKLRQMSESLTNSAAVVRGDENNSDVVVRRESLGVVTTEAVTNGHGQEVLSSDWGDDAGDTSASQDEHQPATNPSDTYNNTASRSPTLLDTVKVSVSFFFSRFYFFIKLMV
jgi:chromosome segregation ATPase